MKEYDTFKLILFVCTAHSLCPSALWPRPVPPTNAIKCDEKRKTRRRNKISAQKPIPRNIKTKRRWRRKVHKNRTAAREWRQLCQEYKRIRIAEEMTVHESPAWAHASHSEYEIAFRLLISLSLSLSLNLPPLPSLQCDCLWFWITFYFVMGERCFTLRVRHSTAMQFWWAPFPSAWTAERHSNQTIPLNTFIRKRIQWAHYPQGSSP